MELTLTPEEKQDVLKARGYRIAKMPAIWLDLSDGEHTEEITIAVTEKTWNEVKVLHYRSGIIHYSVDKVFEEEFKKAVIILMKTIINK